MISILRTYDINKHIVDLVDRCNSPFFNICIRFYIDDVLFRSMIIKKSYYFNSKGVDFEDLHSFLKCNNHFDYFHSCDFSFYEGKITCHGHGEFYGTDRLIINFRRINNGIKKENV